jgi:DNA processing protein
MSAEETAGPLPGEVRALLALHLVPGLGPRLTAALLDRFGSASAALRASADDLRQIPHLGAKLAPQIAEALRCVDPDVELERMAQFDTHLLVLGSASYPSPLATIAVPPHLLYVRGRFEPRDSEAIAIVGSRVCTAYGRRTADRLAGDLARAGFTIVSGLARGIDAAAHRGALHVGGRTIAVLAGGLSKIYPPEHRELAAAVQAAGALLSEAGMMMEPMAGMFPARNRIISGLSRAVIIVEAHARSGALITARHAAEQGREVFAVPGPVDSEASAGTLALLRQGARLVHKAEDVLEDLRGVAPLVPLPTGEEDATRAGSTTAPAGLDDSQRRIWELLSEGRRHIDDLSRTLELPVAALSGMLMVLEMKKVVRRAPGNHYERC